MRLKFTPRRFLDDMGYYWGYLRFMPLLIVWYTFYDSIWLPLMKIICKVFGHGKISSEANLYGNIWGQKCSRCQHIIRYRIADLTKKAGEETMV